MEKKSIFKILLPFLPLLAIYIVVFLVFSTPGTMGDEMRHIKYADNLTHGFYTNSDNPEIGNGPGYPLVLSLFVLIKSPYNIIKLLNIVFIIGAVVYFYRTLLIYISQTPAIVSCYLFGLYPPLLKWMIYMYSESLSVFLICGFLYHFIKLCKQTSNRYLHLTLSALFLGFLALTKVIFGYVILTAAIFYLLYYLFKRSIKTQNSLLVLTGGFIICIPFLIYTYTLTGKMFYWGTQGGEILYWHSSPYTDEYGDWISSGVTLDGEKQDYFDTSSIVKNHKSFIESLEPYSNVQRDEIFKKKAIENIERYPLKYIENTGASALRLFFNYPNSYTQQKLSTYFYIIPNMFLVVFLFLSIYLVIRKAAAISFEIRFIAFISLVYMGGIILLNGRVRHLLPIVPLLLLFIIFVFKDFIRFQITEGINKNKLKRSQSISKNSVSDNLR